MDSRIGLCTQHSEEPLGCLDIAPDLFAEQFGRIKPFFIPHPAQKLQACPLNRFGNLVAKHERLNCLRIAVEGWANPDIGNRVQKISGVHSRPGNVDTLARYQFIVWFEIQRRDGHGAATASATYDSSLDLKPTAQQPASTGYSSFLNPLAYMRAADNNATREDRWYLDEFEFLLPPSQGLHSASLTVTECEIPANAQSLRVQSVDKILLDESVWRERCKLRVESHCHDELDPHAFDQPELLLERADEFRGQIGCQNANGMRIKGQRSRAYPELASAFHDR